ncbi:Dynein assembly factor with WDR repeat domains 1 [Blattella germanica]|nr:Dynein assembly factor with WDR repeat domains 1 [Blattella germanica]
MCRVVFCLKSDISAIIRYSNLLVGELRYMQVLDIAFDYKGYRLATASSDATARIWDVHSDFKLLAKMKGHSEEVSKVCFNPAGNQLLTASLDKTARVWNSDTGSCIQILEGHTDDVFSCAYSYNGDLIITASKDNTCRIWK